MPGRWPQGQCPSWTQAYMGKQHRTELPWEKLLSVTEAEAYSHKVKRRQESRVTSSRPTRTYNGLSKSQQTWSGSFSIASEPLSICGLISLLLETELDQLQLPRWPSPQTRSKIKGIIMRLFATCDSLQHYCALFQPLNRSRVQRT